MEKKGIEETKEIIDLIFSVIEIGKSNILTGITPITAVKMAIEFASEDSFTTKLSKAIDGISELPDELLDIDSKEFSELSFFILKHLKDLVK